MGRIGNIEPENKFSAKLSQVGRDFSLGLSEL